jgi:hypothetical protein
LPSLRRVFPFAAFGHWIVLKNKLKNSFFSVHFLGTSSKLSSTFQLPQRVNWSCLAFGITCGKADEPASISAPAAPSSAPTLKR